jgi:hypothetical protein
MENCRTFHEQSAYAARSAGRLSVWGHTEAQYAILSNAVCIRINFCFYIRYNNILTKIIIDMAPIARFAGIAAI